MKTLTVNTVVAAMLLVGSQLASATLITHEFNNDDSLSDWVVDHTAPAGFEIINSELVMTIDGVTAGQSGDENTQGMKLDIGESTYLSIDMFISEDWLSNERYAGLWGIGYVDGDPAPQGNAILEYQTANGVVAYDTDWIFPATSLFNVGQFNNLKFLVSDAGVEYFVNNILVHTDDDNGIDFFGEVVLNAHNEGTGFSVRFDNLTYGTVPEPTTTAMLGLGLLGMGLFRRKRKA